MNSSVRKGKIIGKIVLIAMLLALIPQPALADIAPPEQPPGGNPVPGAESTQVRMVAETVLIEVISVTPSNSLGKARVTATFDMLNLGTQDEALAVRFPLTSNYGSDYGNKELEEFRAKVGGGQVRIAKITSDFNGYYDGPWAEFNVVFPVGKEVNIEVSYLVEGEGEYPFIALKYILATGAGWKDTIGSADLVLRLPYEVTAGNVIFDTELGWSMTTPGGQVDGKEVRWHFEDLEPDVSSNFSVSLVMPMVWRAVLREQENLANNSNDGEAWGRLGKLYKECFFLRRGFREDAGGLELYVLSQEAYQKSVTLLPEDAVWKAGFADLLWTHWYYSERFKAEPDYKEVLQALELLRQSLEIDPKTEKAIMVLDDIRYSTEGIVEVENGKYTLLLLTATPTIVPTQTSTAEPTATVQTTETPGPTLRPTYTLEPVEPTLTKAATTETLPPTQPVTTSKPILPVCGTAALAPVSCLFWLRRTRIKGSLVDKNRAS